MTATEAEVSAVHAPGTAIAPYAPGAVEEYRPRIVMAPEDAKALDDQLRANQLAVLRPKVDYDTIPGMGDKPTLLKPGAEKLLQWFAFGSRSVEVKTELDDPERPSGVADKAGRIGVTYRTDVVKAAPGVGEILVATCEGYAGYDEDRFYITAEDAKAKAETRERRNAARYNRDPKPAKWLFAEEYRAPWNTLIKMAQKRSYVGAAIDATAAAGLFTQDLEDMTPPPGRDDDDSGGTHCQAAAGDAWENSTPAPPRQNRGNGQPAGGHPDSAPPWTVDRAIEEAASFKTEAEGQKLWRESAARVIAGDCTPGQATHIQNIISARIADRRKEASGRLLRQLSETDEWRAKVEELASDEDAAEAIRELSALTPDQVDMTRAQRISRAIVARFPKAALQAGEGDAG